MTQTRSIAIIAFALLAPRGTAQQPVIPIWPGAAPGSESWTQKEVEYPDGAKRKMVRNIVRPTLTAYLPERSKSSGTAIVICPGGGFRFLSWESEGTAVAEWLRDRGIAAFVLKYRVVDTGATEAEFQKNMAAFFAMLSRLPSSPQERPPADLNPDNIIEKAADDGRQAVRVVRKRAQEWGIAPDRIGIMGFSAGGVVTAEVAMHHDAECLPDFAADIYGPPFGKPAIPADAPPLFILCASDDRLAAVGSAHLYLDWREAGKPAELHIYAKGGHGFGMIKRGVPVDHWIDRLGDWLEGLGLLKAAR